MARVRSLGNNEGGLPEYRSSSLGKGAIIVLRMVDSRNTQHCCAVAGGRVTRTLVYWNAWILNIALYSSLLCIRCC